jgi:DNA-binding IscR family transcriptional regulator
VASYLTGKRYLSTTRGRNGGIRLMREPRHINIAQVARDTADQLDIGRLQRSDYLLRPACICVLRGALRDARAKPATIRSGRASAP